MTYRTTTITAISDQAYDCGHSLLHRLEVVKSEGDIPSVIWAYTSGALEYGREYTGTLAIRSHGGVYYEYDFQPE